MPDQSDKRKLNREDLVAYLDGELDAGDARRVERVLSRDDTARQQIDLYARTWEMLDELDVPRASEQFTQRTIASIEDESGTRVMQTRSGNRARSLRAWTAAAVAAIGLTTVAGISFRVASRPRPQRTEVLLRELPSVENLHRYADIPSADFLRALQEQGTFHGPGSNEGPGSDEE